MLINDEIRRCVAFVARKHRDDYHIGGTAFFVVHEIEGNGGFQAYCVTARHVIKDACESDKSDGVAHLRLNAPDGGWRWLRIPHDQWEHHKSDNIDVSVAAISEDIEG